MQNIIIDRQKHSIDLLHIGQREMSQKHTQLSQIQSIMVYQPEDDSIYTILSGLSQAIYHNFEQIQMVNIYVLIANQQGNGVLHSSQENIQDKDQQQINYNILTQLQKISRIMLYKSTRSQQTTSQLLTPGNIVLQGIQVNLNSYYIQKSYQRLQQVQTEYYPLDEDEQEDNQSCYDTVPYVYDYLIVDTVNGYII